MKPERMDELRLSYCYADPSVFTRGTHVLTVQVGRADGTAVGGFAIEVESEVAEFVKANLAAAAERDRLAAECEALTAALKPFAIFGKNATVILNIPDDEDEIVWESADRKGHIPHLMASDFREAAALSGESGGE